MAVIEPASRPKGRNFTAEELVGKTIRIVSPDGKLPVGHAITITADGEHVANAYKVTVVMEASAITQAIIRLYRLDLDSAEREDVPTEVAVAYENIEIAVSAIVSGAREKEVD